jgi:zinc transporter, ZIP family
MVVVVSTVSAVVGFFAVSSSPHELEALFQAFAAGAVLTMLTDSMIPEAYRLGGRLAGAMTVLGFALAFLLA